MHFPWKAGILALLLAFTQVGIGLALSPGKSFAPAYQNFCQWDCFWYEAIARYGYQTTIPPTPQSYTQGNVAFFPGFPIPARVFSAFGLPIPASLVLSSQLASIFFWLFFLLFLRRWKVSPTLQALSVGVVISHPAAFYLVSGYSESLFLAGLLGMLYFSLVPKTAQNSALAAICGFTMSATRIVGLPLALCPVVLKRPGVGLFSLAGGLSFFAFCYLKWGHWDLYMQTQRIGWGIAPNYLAIFHWHKFNYAWPWDHWSTVSSGWAFLAFALAEALLWARRRFDSGIATRAQLYLAALILLTITISGLEAKWFYSLVRYSLPWTVLLALCAAHLLTQLSPSLKRPWRAAIFLAYAILIGFFLISELTHWREHLHGKWFA